MKPKKNKKHITLHQQNEVQPVLISTAMPEIISTAKWSKFNWLIYAFIFFIISIVWGKLTNYTWDDDAVTRYMNVQSANTNKLFFLDSWTRPLFTIIFYLPIQIFGRMGLVVMMSFLTAASGCLLYKALATKETNNVSIIVIFLIFQTFLFGISRDAMTEPLASFVLCLGIYFFYKKKYIAFALVGSLLPLARTETILLLPIWALVLILSKRYWQVLLLGTGIVAWWLGFYLYSSNFMAFFNELLKTGETKNRYAHTAVGHHFLKYIYVLGPVIFYFVLLGFLIRLKKFKDDYFILLQFIVGFLLYVFFSAYLDLGQSGGALRNLVTIAPLAAIMGYYGVQYWLSLIPDKNSISAPIDTLMKRIILVFYTLILLLFAWQLFTDKLVFRQTYDESEKDYTIFLYLLAASVLIIFSILPLFKKLKLIILALLIIVQISFVLNYESPQSHGNKEREIMGKMAEIVNSSALSKETVLNNHVWFTWSSNVKSNNKNQYIGLSIDNIRNAKPNTVIMWESHYNNKNYANIDINKLFNDTTLIPILDLVDSTTGFTSVFFIKNPNNFAQVNNLFNHFKLKYPEESKYFYYQGNFQLNKEKNLPSALANFNSTLQINPSLLYTYYLRGNCYLQMNKLTEACADLKIASKLGNNDAQVLLAKYCK